MNVIRQINCVLNMIMVCGCIFFTFSLISCVTPGIGKVYNLLTLDESDYMKSISIGELSYLDDQYQGEISFHPKRNGRYELRIVKEGVIDYENDSVILHITVLDCAKNVIDSYETKKLHETYRSFDGEKRFYYHLWTPLNYPYKGKSGDLTIKISLKKEQSSSTPITLSARLLYSWID